MTISEPGRDPSPEAVAAASRSSAGGDREAKHMPVTIASLHPLVQEVIAAYLAALDAEAAGLVEGVYLVGSTALGEFRPRASDVDVVAVTAKRPEAADVSALERAHLRLRRRVRRPLLDGVYVTWDDLTQDSRRTTGLPYSYNGRFHSAGGRANPVVWCTLARYGIACRGPASRDLHIDTDPGVLAAWTLDNLDRYWRPLLDSASALTLWRFASLTPYGAVWIVLGVTRLHYTLDTGDICSKERAGCHALEVFPERWHRVIDESLRIRRADSGTPDLAGALREITDYLGLGRIGGERPLYRTPFGRRRDVLAFGDMVVAEARRRWHPRRPPPPAPGPPP